MSIVVLSATLNLNCFATKTKQTKMPLALAVIMALNEYSPLSPLFLKAVKVHLPRLEEVPLVARALPQAVPAAKHSSLSGKLPRVRIKRTLNDRPVRINAKYVITLGSRTGWDGCIEIEGRSSLQYGGLICCTKCMNLE
jgi:hypothetical protein